MNKATCLTASCSASHGAVRCSASRGAPGQPRARPAGRGQTRYACAEVAMDQPTVLLDFDGAVARITLNRPAALNAVNHALARDLEATVGAALTAPGVRLVLVQG